MPAVPKFKPEPIQEYIAKLRRCLMCRKLFESSWCGERICPDCKESAPYTRLTALPEQHL